jgi:hypothetical protein
MTKRTPVVIGGSLLNFEHSGFGIVSGFGFQYSDFVVDPEPVDFLDVGSA